MTEVKITYYGHSCFMLSTEKGSIVLDPYAEGSVPGTELPEGITADAVYCSHGHGDHNAADRITLSGRPAPFEKTAITVPHDDKGGSLRGMSDINMFQIEDVKAVHFGDIGRDLTEEETAVLKGADIIMIPVGGYFTIDAGQAYRIMEQLSPALTILMHFRRGNSGYDVIAEVSDVKKVFKEAEDLDQPEYVYVKGAEKEKVIILKPFA